jgi:nucleolar protein 53
LKTVVELKGIRKQIRAPGSGASYNPNEEDRQRALEAALEISNKHHKDHEEFVKKLETARANFDRNTCEIEESDDDENMEPVVAAAAEEGAADEQPYLSLNNPVACKRKTQSQRNAQLRIDEQMKLLREQKDVKSLAHALNSLKATNQALKREAQKRAQIRAKIDALKKMRTADQWAEKLHLGNTKFVTPVPDVPFVEDLGDSLRTMKPKGNLLLDQFNRMKCFGVIESNTQAEHINVKGSAYRSVIKRSWKQDDDQ